jgi:RNA polymerase sigma factor (sigma-70 family)
MDEYDWLAERFEQNRPHLRAVAYRVLGSASEADDAVQEAWLRVSRTGTGGVENLGGWMTTIVARVSLNMLRSRVLRREDPMDEAVTGQVNQGGQGDQGVSGAQWVPGDQWGETDPEHEAVLADSVGLALLVVLDTLTPAERLAFVLHDMFAVPFEEIAPIVERSPTATRQLASRARRRVQQAGPDAERQPDEGAREREVVTAFLAASREGDFEALIALLDPEIVLRADDAVVRLGADREVAGARAVAGTFSGRAEAARPALVDGAAGAVWMHRGKPRVVFTFAIIGGKVTAIEMIGDPERIAGLEVIPG